MKISNLARLGRHQATKRFVVTFAVCALLTLVQGSDVLSDDPADPTWYWWMYADRGSFDPAGEGDTGYDSSIALNSENEPWIAYYLKSNSEGASQDLMLSRMTLPEGTWTTETVDSVGNVGKWCSLVIDNGDRPHIAYYDESNADLKYAFHDGTAWQIQVVDSDGFVGAYCSLALVGASRPMIAYYGDVDVGLRVATYDGSAWTIETVDGGRGRGWYTSIVVGRDQAPHIAYYDPVNTSLRYATKTGGVWMTTMVDPGGNVGGETAIAVDVDGLPQIAYRDVGNEALKHAAFDGGSWNYETVDDVSRVRSAIGLVIDDANRPHIAYFNADTLKPLMAVLDGGWSFKTIIFPNFYWLETPPGPRGEDLSLAPSRTRLSEGHIAMRDNRESSLVWGQSVLVKTGDSDPSPLLGLTGYTHSKNPNAVGGAGDINGDGIDDLMIGSPVENRVHVLYGGDPAVLAAVPIQDRVDVTLNGVVLGDAAGEAVAIVGDVNDDGYDDMLIGAPAADPDAKENAGKAYLVYGGPALPAVIDLANADVTFNGVSAADGAGLYVSGAGDVNGDTYADLIVGADEASYVIYGGMSLPATIELSSADITLPGADSRLKGMALVKGGDVNGDDMDDLLVGVGVRVHVIYGGLALPAVLDPAIHADVTVTHADRVASLSMAGDFNSDGYGDFVSGVPNLRNDAMEAFGQVSVFLGGPALPAALADTDAVVKVRGEQQWAFCGWRVAAAGDINGDSFDDIIFESPIHEISHSWLFYYLPPRLSVVYHRTFILRGGANVPEILQPAAGNRTYMDKPVNTTEQKGAGYFPVTGIGDFDHNLVGDQLVGGDYPDDALSPDGNVLYGRHRSYFDVTRLAGDTFEFLAETGFEQAVLNPRILLSVHFGAATNADILFGIDTKSAGYFFFDADRNRPYIFKPGTLEKVNGYRNVASLWTDAAVRIPDQLLSWDPDGDGDDELWAFLGTDYYVFDWTTQQFGPAMPLADIGAGGLSFDALAALDRGDGMELLVGAADTDLFVYNPTTFAGTVFPSVTLTTGGVPLRAAYMVSIDANLDGTDVLYIVDLETNTVWTGLETGVMTRATFFSSLWSRGVSKMVTGFQDVLLAYKAFDGATPPRVYGIHHDAVSD